MPKMRNKVVVGGANTSEILLGQAIWPPQTYWVYSCLVYVFVGLRGRTNVACKFYIDWQINCSDMPKKFRVKNPM